MKYFNGYLRVFILVISLMLIPAVAWSAQETLTAEEARILEMDGIVKIKLPKSPVWASAVRNSTIKPGTQLKTDKQSFCFLILHDGSTVKIGEKTQVLIKDLSSSNKSSTSKIKFYVGRIWNNVSKSSEKKTNFEVEAPYTLAAVRGTVFEMFTDGIKDELIVHEGEVEANSAIMKVEPGETSFEQPGNEKIASGQPANVQLSDGKASGEKVESGQAESGKTVNEQPDGKKTSAAQPASGQVSAGKASAGKTGAEQPASGQSSASGTTENGSKDSQASAGKTAEGQSSDGKATAGKSAGEQPMNGQSPAGKTPEGQPVNGQATANQASAGKTSDGQPASRQATDGKAAGEQSQSGQASTGKASEGQPASERVRANCRLQCGNGGFQPVEKLDSGKPTPWQALNRNLDGEMREMVKTVRDMSPEQRKNYFNNLPPAQKQKLKMIKRSIQLYGRATQNNGENTYDPSFVEKLKETTTAAPVSPGTGQKNSNVKTKLYQVYPSKMPKVRREYQEYEKTTQKESNTQYKNSVKVRLEHEKSVKDVKQKVDPKTSAEIRELERKSRMESRIQEKKAREEMRELDKKARAEMRELDRKAREDILKQQKEQLKKLNNKSNTVKKEGTKKQEPAKKNVTPKSEPAEKTKPITGSGSNSTTGTNNSTNKDDANTGSGK